MKNKRKLDDAFLFLYNILNGIDTAVFTIDIVNNDEFEFYGFNRVLQEIMGFKPAEFIGKTPEQLTFITQNEKEMMLKQLRNCFSSGKKIEYLQCFSLNNKNRLIITKLIPLINNGGKVYRIIGIGNDITEKKKAEEELQKAYDEIKKLKEHLEQENICFREELNANYNIGEIITQNAGLRKILKEIEQVALTNAPVLIQGESGTGKELIARAIHKISNLRNKPLIKINCATIPEGLVESELFGHEKGSFTGAIQQKTGKFEIADGGTIFLDEIGEMPKSIQPKMLRVLQEGEFERVGGIKTIKVNVRVIAATNRILNDEVKKGNFREDLFYRLNVFPVNLPPLRERPEDIPLLINMLIKKYNKKHHKNITYISQTDMASLLYYNWPGNIRELENVMERAVILSTGKKLDSSINYSYTDKTETIKTGILTLEQMNKDYITSILEQCHWKVSGKNGAAEILGLKPTTLFSKMEKLGIIQANNKKQRKQ